MITEVFLVFVIPFVSTLKQALVMCKLEVESLCSLKYTLLLKTDEHFLKKNLELVEELFGS